jgi:hypothetical protein
VEDSPRRLEYLPLDALIPHPGNPKGHDEEGIAVSMGQFGVVDLVVLDDRTEQLISGHGRVESFRRLRDAGDAPPEGVTVAEDGTWTVPVIRGWASKDDDEASAVLVALNQGTITGGWIPDKLAMMLGDLQAKQQLTGTFFTDADVDLLLSDVRAPDFAGQTPEGEWEGMPDYENQDLESKHRLVVHFPTEEDRTRFLEQLGSPTVRQNSIWWPHDDGHVGEDWSTQFVTDDAAPEPVTDGA